MKHATTVGVDCYRVQTRWKGQRRVPRHPWSRTWQAEWVGCQWAPRAWTERGIRRRAARWHRNGGRAQWQIDLHRKIRKALGRG